jgi:hypothetical protein
MERAISSYAAGRERAERENDFQAALSHFEEAYSQAKLPAFAFAMAQCHKALGHYLAALLLFTESLKMSRGGAKPDGLDAVHLDVAKRNIELLLSRFAEVRVSLPRGVEATAVSVNGAQLVPTDLNGFLPKPRFYSGAVKSMRPAPKVTLPQTFVLYVQPGAYKLDLMLTDGRRLYLEDLNVTAPLTAVNFNPDQLPAKLIIENIQPGTHMILRGPGSETLVDRRFFERRRRLTLSKLRRGAYELTVGREGFESESYTYQLNGGERESVYLDLRPAPPARKKWKLWLAVGLLSGAAVIATVVVLSVRLSRDDDPPTSGSGTVTMGRW